VAWLVKALWWIGEKLVTTVLWFGKLAIKWVAWGIAHPFAALGVSAVAGAAGVWLQQQNFWGSDVVADLVSGFGYYSGIGALAIATTVLLGERAGAAVSRVWDNYLEALNKAAFGETFEAQQRRLKAAGATLPLPRP
jgi:hypothetical protein